MSPRAVDKRARPGNEGTLTYQAFTASIEETGPSSDLAAVGALLGEATATDEPVGRSPERV
ncbi:MAG TPA: hypothetical protein VGD34_19895 [Kribbella sp.]